jgi:hypothetical protein
MPGEGALEGVQVGAGIADEGEASVQRQRGDAVLEQVIGKASKSSAGANTAAGIR